MDFKNTLAILKEYDVKNINPNQVKDYLIQRNDIAINIAAVILTAIIAVNIHGARSKQLAATIASVETSREKIAAVAELEEARAQLARLHSAFPDGIIEADAIIKELSALANAHNIHIASFQPGQTTETSLYAQTTVSITVSANEYSQIGFFLAGIERSPDIFLVDQVSFGVLGQRRRDRRSRQAAQAPEREQHIEASIQITSRKIKK